MAAFASSYIKTEGSQVTRSADAASMTGANFSSWYRQDEGTVYAEGASIRPLSGSAAGQIVSPATSSNDRMWIAQGSTTFGANFNVSVNNTGQVNLNVGASVPTNTNAKYILSYAFNDSGAVVNGSAVSVDTSCVIPVIDKLFIGNSVTLSAGGCWNGHIRKLSYYPKRLANAQLQALTTP
jgi:hypothetical protein